MKMTVMTDSKGKILVIGPSEVRPAKGRSATAAEIAAAPKIRVGITPVDAKKHHVHSLELPAELAKFSVRDVQRLARVDLSGKTARLVRKS
jgi:hypothetical protein